MSTSVELSVTILSQKGPPRTNDVLETNTGTNSFIICKSVFFLDFDHRLHFNKMTTFWKLDLLLSFLFYLKTEKDPASETL
jgi:hypothetical protein